MAENNTIKVSGIYNGHTIRKNFDVELKLRFTEGQLANSLQFLAGFGKQVILKAQVNKEVLYLGVFNINKIIIDKNGNSFLSLMSNNDYVKLENIEKIMVEDEIKFAGKVTERAEED